MSKFIEVIAVVEGKTEQNFIERVVAPYLCAKNIFISATQLSKPGQKGGDVRFDRLKNDVEIHLKQRKDTYVTTFIDYYGLKHEWPGVTKIAAAATPLQIANVINSATNEQITRLFGFHRAAERFISYICVHEFEALLFSDSAVLAKELGIEEKKVKAVLSASGEAEAINNSPQTAPSKRLDQWSNNGKFSKTSSGIAIAETIGISTMRAQCPVFNAWLQRLEDIQP